jgi:hypothetical protein
MKTKFTYTTHKDIGGFSTIELLIAFSVGIIFLTAAMMVSFSDPTLARQVSLESGQAAALDVALDSTALASSTNKLGSTTAALMKNWSAILTGDHQGTYENVLTTTDISPCLKEIINVTQWNNTFGARHRDITFGTALGSMDIAKALGRGGCDPTPLNDWDNPDSLGSFDPSGIAGAGIAATAIDVKTIDGHLYAFLTSQHGSAASPDFWVIDVTNPNSPQYVSSLDISNGVSWGSIKEGANDLVVIGNYAYVLRNYKVDQLQVIDVSDPTHPTMVTPAVSFESRGVNANCGSCEPQGEVIKYYNGKLYIGLHNTQGPELLVYNIASTPTAPSFVGAIANSFGHSIYDMVINGNYAYVAIKPGNNAQNTKELMVINISGATPTDTGNGYNANIGNNDTAGARSLYLLGNKLYMGRERVSSPKQDLYILNVANPEAPTLLGSKNINQQSGSGSAIQTLYVSGQLAFLGLSKNPEFQTWDISNPAEITTFGCGGFDFPQEVTDIAYANNYVFVAIRSNDFFRVLHDETSDATCN